MSDMAARQETRSETWTVIGLAWLSACAVCLIFLFAGIRGDPAFVLGLRFTQLAGMVQVAIAIAISTVIFQTITGNRILSPSIMGLDALYLFSQTALVFALGGIGYSALPHAWRFVGDVTLMTVLSAALFLPMLRRNSDMMLFILCGFIFGLLFRSLSSLMLRLIDPNDFAVVQGASFASFQSFEPTMLAIGGAVTAAGAAVTWRVRHVLDVLALGRDTAIGLGLDWNSWTVALLLLVVVLVATSTALVGPLAFLGLLVVALAERICGTRNHGVLLPVSCAIGIAVLTGAQATARLGFNGSVVISVIVEFAGGIVFLGLLFARSRA